jgi:hypothetical protein
MPKGWLAVEAVERELVSNSEFPVLREETGNFGEIRGSEATGVAEKRVNPVG